MQNLLNKTIVSSSIWCLLIPEKFIGTLGINVHFSLFRLALSVLKLLQTWGVPAVLRMFKKVAQLAKQFCSDYSRVQKGRQGEDADS